ncbi:MAG: hypothetical protein ACR2LL_10660 [Nitrosopumilus sp.]
MPLDKMSNSEEFVPTHKSIVLHIKGKPAACIIDKKMENESRYNAMMNNSSLKASLIGFLNKHDDFGLLIGFKLKIQTDDDFFEYTVYPKEEFVDTVIFTETIFVITDKLNSLFSLRIVTDQFVKTKTEFEKFQNMLTRR